MLEIVLVVDAILLKPRVELLDIVTIGDCTEPIFLDLTIFVNADSLLVSEDSLKIELSFMSSVITGV